MLEIKRERVFGRTYQILSVGKPVAQWSGHAWKSGGHVELAGRNFELRSSHWGRSFEMHEGTSGGPIRAEARRSGRRWNIIDAEGEYELMRPSAFRGKRQLVRDGSVVGEFRPGRFGSGLTAEFTGVPLPVQVFAGLVVISLQQRQATAAAASSG
ncbi:hypothetical protein ABZ916_24340 [Streptomyces sp. NPDC046853]|uniref:hypothetical protein n=1 Tax=Streptomyces sp. NPDC046853 TaxID=3154920 RepID=UPI0033C6D597